MLLFTNKALNKKYRIIPDVDQRYIHTDYKGMLTEIPDAEILERMIARGSNLVEKISAESKEPKQ